jgi:hypothetical protein
VLVGAALAPGLVSGSPAAAAEPAPPTLVDVRLSRTTVAVRGLATVAVTVSVHLTDPSGVVESSNPEIPAPWPLVQLTKVSGPKTGGAPTYAARDLDLTSGTPQDGSWTTTIKVPSTYEGTWQVTNVTAQNKAGGTLSVDPRTKGITRTLGVTGSHQPALSFGFAPPVVVGAQRRFDVKGRAVDADTGAPVKGLVLTLGTGKQENCGAFGYGGSASTVTDAHGYYAFKALGTDEFYYCVISTVPAKRTGIDQYRTTTLLFRWANPPIQPVISAAADRTPVRVGETVAIRGSVAPLQYTSGRQILLQRLVSGTWRTVDTAVIRQSGRYTLEATPPSAGNHRYRAYTVARFFILAASSPVVLVGAR